MAPNLSVVIPAYNEEGSIAELYRRITEAVKNLKSEGLIGDCELLFVNDGSTDGTREAVLRLRLPRGIHAEGPGRLRRDL